MQSRIALHGGALHVSLLAICLGWASRSQFPARAGVDTKHPRNEGYQDSGQKDLPHRLNSSTNTVIVVLDS